MGSNKYIITKIKCWPVFKQDPFSSTSTVLLVHGRVRSLPAERRPEGLRRRSAVLLRGAAARHERRPQVPALRPRQDGGHQVPHHRVPAPVLRGRELRRCPAENDVRMNSFNPL